MLKQMYWKRGMMAVLSSLIVFSSVVHAQSPDDGGAGNKIFLPFVTQGVTNPAQGTLTTEQMANAISIAHMDEVVVTASTEEIVNASSAGEDFSKSQVFRLDNCADGKPCYLVASLQSPVGDQVESAQTAANSGTLSCSWDIYFSGTAILATMKLNATGTFYATNFRAPLTWTSGNQAGTKNVTWGTTWSELSGVSFNPGVGTRSGNTASAWAQGKLNVSAPFTIIDRVLGQTLNVSTSQATCSHSGW